MKHLTPLSLLLLLLATPVLAQEEVLLRSTVVVLSDDPEQRADIEDRLVAKARANDYDAVASYRFAPDVSTIDNRRFLALLEEQRIGAVLMLRPAAVGENSSLDAVRNSVSPEVFGRMREFAQEVTRVDPDKLIAVVHMAIYAVKDGSAEFLSAGAVWLDEEVENQDEGIERLMDLVLYNVNAVRPAIRRHLGLPPLQ